MCAVDIYVSPHFAPSPLKGYHFLILSKLNWWRVSQGLLGTLGDPREQAGWCAPFHPQTDTRQGLLSQRLPALPPRAATVFF